MPPSPYRRPIQRSSNMNLSQDLTMGSSSPIGVPSNRNSASSGGQHNNSPSPTAVNYAFSKQNNTSSRPANLGRGRKQSQRERKELSRAIRRGEVPASLDTEEVDLQTQQEILFEGNTIPSPAKRTEISLNHLINFSFPPRQTLSVSVTIKKRSGSNYQPFNKERFINANYRFVVKPNVDYSPTLGDADTIVDWANIIQVIMPTSKEITCPICLSAPIAGRMTRCGHVYCFPCILHYLHLGNSQHGTCPICQEYVYSKDLKCTKVVQVHPVKAGNTVEMTLMKRALNATVSLPRKLHQTWSDSTGETAPPSAMGHDEASSFSKLLLSTSNYHLTKVLEPAKTELSAALQQARHEESLLKAMIAAESPDGSSASLNTSRTTFSRKDKEIGSLVASADDRPYLEMAVAEVNREIELATTLYGPETDRSSGRRVVGQGERRKGSKSRSRTRVDTRERPVTPQVPWNLDSPETETSMLPTPDASPFESRPPIVTDDPEQEASRKGKKSAQKTKKGVQTNQSGTSSWNGHYYFYQSTDGQHIYLHPLDVKILKHEFEEYERFPDHINVKVGLVQESTMNEELRKKCRYLSHIPLSCDVNFCEVDLSSVVSPETLEAFAKEIQERKDRQMQKVRREQEEHDRQVAIAAANLASSPSNISPYLPHTHISPVSSWEDPSQFETMFPVATPAKTNIPSRRNGSDSGEETTTQASGSQSAAGPSKNPSGGAAAAAPFSFAKIAGAPSSLVSSPASPWGNTSAARKSAGASSSANTFDEYDDFGGGWTLDLALDDFGMEDEMAGTGGGKKGRKVGKKGSKKVLLVSNGGKRGGF